MIPRLILAFLLAATAARGAALELPGRSISSSKQFVVFAQDPNVRSRVSIKAEDYKEAFLKLLGIRDEWKLNVALNLGATPPNMRNPPTHQIGLYEGDGNTLKIQLDVFDLGFLDTQEFDVELISTILLEYAYRNTPIRVGRTFDPPSAWFAEGLYEQVRTMNEGVKSGVYATLLASGRTPRMDDFLDTRPESLDSTSRAIFRAQSMAMLDAIKELPDGRAGLHTFLAVPRRARPDPREIVDCFPSLAGDREALGRKWILAIARASATNRVNLLERRETAQELDRILDIKALPDPKHPEVAAMSGPYALETIARSQNGRFILIQKGDELLRLSIRAHPLYKPLVDEYLLIVRELTAKPKRRVDKQVAAAEEIRAKLGGQSSEMESYLDWVEATQLKTESEEFTNLMDDVDKIEEPAPRSDAISRYLDSVAERGW